MDDARAVEEAVRAYLDGQRTATPCNTAGVIERALRLAARVRSDVPETPDLPVAVRRVATTRVDGDEAEAELDATSWAVFTFENGERVETPIDLSGPVTLRRIDGEWRVLDLTVGGRRISDTYWEPKGELEQGALRVRVLLLCLQTHVTRVYVELENTGARPIAVVDLWRGARVLLVRRYFRVPALGHVAVEPGETKLLFAGWSERLPRWVDEVRFVLRAGEATGPQRFRLHFAASRERVVELRNLPLDVRLSRRVRVGVRWAPLAVAFAAAFLHRWRVAGVLLAAWSLAALTVAALAAQRRLVRGRDLLRAIPMFAAFAGFGLYLALTPSFLSSAGACTHLRKTSNDFVYDVAFFGARPAADFVTPDSPLRHGSIAATLDRLRARLAVPRYAQAPRGVRIRCSSRAAACYRYTTAHARLVTAVACTDVGPRIRDARLEP